MRSRISSLNQIALALAADGSRQGAVEEATFISDSGKIKLVERKAKQIESVNLTAAKRVVAVGRDVQKKEDISLAEALAKALGAEVGCTRPIAEGEGWMVTERYIGVPSVMIKPDIYFGVGVSGQVQYMIGVNGAKVIIAVNKDKNASIFSQCDYGIAGDLYKVLPALTKLIQG